MIRSLISVVRNLIIGPKLTRLSRLHFHEIEQLIAKSEAPQPASATPSSNGTSGVVSGASPEELRALSELRADNARLSERVDVLERLLERTLKASKS